MVKRNRRASFGGERNGRAKLTKKMVESMREMRADGTSYVALGREFGVSGVAARKAVLGIHWPEFKDER